MESEVLIEARALARRYGPTLAVDSLDLTLRKGEILGLLGPNGAGKSTTMKMLTGNLAPTAGEVRIGGKSLREDAKAAKQALGYLPEQPPVYAELTVDEYLAYCAGLHGIGRKARAEAVASAKRDCGLADVGRRLIGNLSKGYQQRVGLAQAIVHRPPVIVLDEPTVGLDPIQIREIRALIAALGRNHSVILSSHILSEIQAVCSRVMIINRGRVVYNEAIDAAKAQRFDSIAAAFRQLPDARTLETMNGVRRVLALGEGRYRIEVDAGADPRAEARTLEEIFVELVMRDTATLPEAA